MIEPHILAELRRRADAGASTELLAARYDVAPELVGIVTGRTPPLPRTFKEPYLVDLERAEDEDEECEYLAEQRRTRVARLADLASLDLSELTPEQLRAVEMRDRDGLGCRKIAALEGVGHVAIWRRQQRADKRIARMIAERLGAPGGQQVVRPPY